MYLILLSIDYFEDYLINYHEEVEALVSNDYEDIERIRFKQYLENGIYLITQNRYSGKPLDIALLKVSDEVNEIIGIQISIINNNILNKEQIIDSLLNLKRNIYSYYHIDVDEKDLFFCYIFDWDNKDEKILKKCEKIGVKYLFFDVTKNCFKDNIEKTIKNLKLNLLSYISICPEPKKNENINYITEDIFPIFDNQLKLNILKGPFIEPNQKQNESIKKYLKKNLQLSFLI